MAPKKKQEKMNLGEFLTNQSLGSWADEMDAQPIPAVPASYGGARDGGERRAFTQPAWESARSGGGGGLGDRGASYDRPRYPDREQLPLPTKPPFTAHLGNLTYDVTASDIEGFFAGCEVTNVRIVEDKLDHKPKGFGYVEFASVEGLKKALTLTDTNFMGRNVKISVAEPPKDRPEPTRDFSDWTRKGPLPELPQNTRQPSNRGFNRNMDNMSDAGSERNGGRKPAFFENDGKVRDLGNWERKGPLSPVPGNGPPMREGGRVREGGPPREARSSPSWGEGRSDTGSRPPRKEFEPRPSIERAPTAAEQDTQWRARMKADPSPAATPEASSPSSPAPTQAAPKERPRLNLAKRTVSTADPEATGPGATDSKASPFGAARPIDTAAKERELDEKRQEALKQKKELEDKAREEKAAKEAAARAERAERADRGQANEDGKPASSAADRPNGNPRRPSRQQNGTKGAPKENGEATAQSRPSFHILQREAEVGEGADDTTAEEADQGVSEAVDGPANGNIIGDKETLPQDVIREKPVDGGDASAQDVKTTAESMEADGWNTVAGKKTKNSRRGGGGGGGGSRALAS